jgi:hypothetical protein
MNRKAISMSARRVWSVLLLIGLAGCQSVLKEEPPKGTLAAGRKVLVDDGSCPAGQVKQVTGATAGTQRVRECIPMPK